MNNYVFNLLYEEVEAPEAEGSSELRGLGDCDGSNQKPEKVAQQWLHNNEESEEDNCSLQGEWAQ